ESKESISDISTYKGLFASEDGSTYNPLKHGKYNIGIELESGATEEEMKEDFSGRQIQPGQLAMTYHYMQQKTTDPNFGVDGAKFDNPDQLLEAMESDSDLHQRVYDYVISLINDNNMRENVFTGTAHNYYADSKFETGDIDTSNVEIVGCTTHENGTKIYELSVNWTDEQGNIHTDVYKFKERCGGQPLDLINFTTSVRQIPEDEIEDDDPGDKPGDDNPGDDNPGDDDPGDDDPGDDDPGDELDKKNEQALEDNAGPRVDQRNLDNNVTPQTPLKDDQKNFEAIEKQKEEDAKKAEEAQRIKEEQAAKEEQAKKEAEARRQAEEEAARKASEEEKAREAEAATKAEAAKKAAEEEAAKKQAEAAEAERKAAEEEAAKKAAEEEAKKNNVENSAEADSNNDAGADERGDMFNNGDY
ncbi:cell envelope integrity protein TolA, partial [Candidatus Saccharibacteria bacterium]|nr:cell envelope integrity protein TolA [Candidatus Saccharibacteria bacterium]